MPATSWRRLFSVASRDRSRPEQPPVRVVQGDGDSPQLPRRDRAEALSYSGSPTCAADDGERASGSANGRAEDERHTHGRDDRQRDADEHHS